jgi:hypothetical protein
MFLLGVTVRMARQVILNTMLISTFAPNVEDAMYVHGPGDIRVPNAMVKWKRSAVWTSNGISYGSPDGLYSPAGFPFFRAATFQVRVQANPAQTDQVPPILLAEHSTT